jgi:phosphoribosylamine--glycine ligase
MNILLLGSGGREHALAWKMAQSDQCTHLFIAPGNAGTQQCGTNVDLDIKDFPAVQSFCEREQIDLMLVGPEEPLVLGIQDHFKKHTNIKVVGPNAEAAQLEGSKAYAKEFMMRHKIPTAGYKEFNAASLQEGLDFIATIDGPVVLKADGIAAGKGVVIVEDTDTAQAELTAMLQGKFGAASEKVIIEEFLDGIEFSVFAITDGKDYKLLPVAKDYKRIGEGDKGLNTGGMGAISPVPFVDDILMQKVIDRIVTPSIDGIHKENLDYKGFVFFGLIRVGDEPFVIEYNCRMGDPETEVVIPRLKSDLVPILDSLFDGSLSTQKIDFHTDYATTIMMVSGGYPEAYEKGKVISDTNKIEGSLPFYAGAQENEAGEIITSGGRVLALTSLASTMEEALALSYKNADLVQFDKKHYRTDIGFDLK